ncbi:helix-turn-helix domain-containing protein [Ectothiorhodospiraceae bacterium WFHF3C12]|nr:helix-turn-helix domain-containing protein [Ectothiorhodospiraceae bacterium WFHF3C12]
MSRKSTGHRGHRDAATSAPRKSGTQPTFGSECADCAFRQVCLPAGLAGANLERFGAIVQHPRLIQKRVSLQTPGAAPEYAFAIRAGSIKTHITNEAGEDQVTGVWMAGEVVGLENLGGTTQSGYQTERHTLLCRIPLRRLVALSAEMPALQHQMLRLLSQEIVQTEIHQRAIAGMRAEKRLAFMLLDIAARNLRNGGSESHFELPIRHGELANLLGLAHETLSRVFSQLTGQGLLECEGREVRLRDITGLERMVGVSPRDAHEQPRARGA